MYLKFCMYFVCLYLLITALNPAVVGYSLYRRTCFTKGTIPLLVLNPYRIHCPAASSWCEERVLISSLLTLFAHLQEEQYFRLLSCYTTATFHASIGQQWRLNLCTVVFESTAGNITATVRHHDHRRIICYLPHFRS